jgi:hypothetical protein
MQVVFFEIRLRRSIIIFFLKKIHIHNINFTWSEVCQVLSKTKDYVFDRKIMYFVSPVPVSDSECCNQYVNCKDDLLTSSGPGKGELEYFCLHQL